VPRTYDYGHHKLRPNAAAILYNSVAAKRKLRAEQEKRDEQSKKKMPCLLAYGSETSLISNIKPKN